jgi:hypothetical protein
MSISLWSKLKIMKKVKIALLVFVLIFGILNITENYLYWVNSNKRIDTEILSHIVLKYFLIPTFVIYLYKDLKLKKEI